MTRAAVALIRQDYRLDFRGYSMRREVRRTESSARGEDRFAWLKHRQGREFIESPIFGQDFRSCGSGGLGQDCW